jgi:hypothetical protein
VATLDGHPLTGQRMPSLTNTKLKNIFELLRQFLVRFVHFLTNKSVETEERIKSNLL